MMRLHGRVISALLTAAFLAAGIMIGSALNEKNSAQVKEKSGAYASKSPFTDETGRILKSVVGVNNYRKSGGKGARGSMGKEEKASMGSGVVVYNQYVLTNYHVIEGASRLTVSAPYTQRETDATVCVYDAELDAAVLFAKGLEANSVPLGDSDRLQVGEWTICVGNPLSDALFSTVTAGIVSGLDREIVSYENDGRSAYINRMIQTDAAVNYGFSGGGLFNVLGQLMGIPTMKFTGSSESGAMIEGIGLAIPINAAKPLIEKAIREKLTDENINAGA